MIISNRLKKYLPVQYKNYANDLDKLKETMASLYRTGSQLFWLSYHMECNTGYLHDSIECLTCL